MRYYAKSHDITAPREPMGRIWTAPYINYVMHVHYLFDTIGFAVHFT